MTKDIYVLVGPAAHGKSTYASNIVNKYFKDLEPNAVDIGYGYINADLVRKALYGDASIQGDPEEVWGKVYEAYTKHLRNSNVNLIIIDNTSLTWRLRKRYYRLAESICNPINCDYILYTVFFTPNLKRALLWNKKRDRHVPDDVIKRHCETFQGPTDFEKENCIIEIIE